MGRVQRSCVFSIERSVFLGVGVVSDFGNGTCLFREYRSKRARRCRSRFRSPPNRDNALQTGDPTRTNLLACMHCTNAGVQGCANNAQSPPWSIRISACQACHECTRNNALFCRSGSPASGACSVPASGLFVVSEIRDPGTRSSMTGARTLRRRCCRHHRAPGHRSRRTIAVGRASAHMPHERGVDSAAVSTDGCFAAAMVDMG